MHIYIRYLHINIHTFFLSGILYSLAVSYLFAVFYGLCGLVHSLTYILFSPSAADLVLSITGVSLSTLSPPPHEVILLRQLDTGHGPFRVCTDINSLHTGTLSFIQKHC